MSDEQARSWRRFETASDSDEPYHDEAVVQAREALKENPQS